MHRKAKTQGPLIETDEALLDLCERLRSEREVALDTEFMGEGRRVPELNLVQLATRDEAWLVDPVQLKSLVPLFALFEDSDVLKVAHAGEQDIRLLEAVGCHAVHPLFDCQIAAGFLGHGASVGLQTVLRAVLGVRLPKGTGFIDWSVRPIPAAEKKYALGDVKHLIELKARLVEELETRGRLEWTTEYTEECLTRWREPRDTAPRLAALARKYSMTPPEYGALVVLDAWRDEESRKVNRPAKRVANDDVMVELARQQPATIRELFSIRTLSAALVRRSGQEILDAIRRGRASPQEPAGPPPSESPLSDEDLALADALRLAARMQLRTLGVADGFFASDSQLRGLAARVARGARVEDTFAGTGWRAKLADGWLREFLEGKMVVGIAHEAGKRRARMMRHDRQQV